MSQILTDTERFHKSLALLLVRAIEGECGAMLSISVTRAHRLHKQVLSELRNIDKTMFTTDMTRKPVGEIIHTSLVKRESSWELRLSTKKAPQANVVLITDENKLVFRKWLKGGFKPTTMADWRAHYDGL